MDVHKIPIQPLKLPLSVYIRRQSSTRWIAQTDYFFRTPIADSEHGEVKLEPGTPIKIPTEISEVCVLGGRILIDWMFEGGYLDITSLIDEKDGVLRFRDNTKSV
jgi:hypothetical protein